MLVDYNNQSFNVDRNLFTSGIVCIVDDVTSAANSNNFSTQDIFQAEEDIILAIAVDSSKIRNAVITTKGNDFCINIPALPGLDNFVPNSF